MFFFEFFDSTLNIDKFLLAGKERVAKAADFDFDFFEGGAGGKFVAAGASNGAVIEILRMNPLFHR